MIGQVLCQTYGWSSALLAICLGNLFLMLVGLAMAVLSTQRRQTTVEHAAETFGGQGRAFFALLMIFSMLAWFSIQLNIMGMSLTQLLQEKGVPIAQNWVLLGIGGLLSLWMCLGMQGVKWLSNLSIPLLSFTILYAIFSAEGTFPASPPLALSWLGGISLVVGANIAAVIDLPTFFQHTKSKKDAVICIFLLFGLVVPCIEGAGLYLAAVTGGTSLFEVFQRGHGLLWMYWINGFVLLCGFLSNNANLYSATAASYSLSKVFSVKTRALFLGGIGTTLALFNPLAHFEGILGLFSIGLGSMGAIILSHFFLQKGLSNPKWIPFASWSCGCLLALIFPITGVGAWDAFISAAAVQMVLKKFIQEKGYVSIEN
jgi:purine-cytosine permease-like protein